MLQNYAALPVFFRQRKSPDLIAEMDFKGSRNEPTFFRLVQVLSADLRTPWAQTWHYSNPSPDLGLTIEIPVEWFVPSPRALVAS